MRNLEGKRILVCGGATGIGAATVRRLCEEGARVALGDLNIEGADALAAELGGAPGQIATHRYDQGDEQSIGELVNWAAGQLGGLDGLFANVADLQVILEDGDILANPVSVWERTLRVNLVGTVLLLRAALPRMLEQGGGAAVLTSSVAGVVGEPARPAYAASKAGINSLCRHVASKWGREGIRCNAVAPGFVLTQQIEAAMPQEMQDAMLRSVRSPRHGRAADIAGAVAFLLSDDAEWVNGQTWRVDGGVSYGL